MPGGGRAALYKTILHYIDLERSTQRSGELQGMPLLVVGVIALGAAFFDIEHKPVIVTFGILFLTFPWIARWYTQREFRKMEAGLDELKGYLWNVVFDAGIWLDIMNDEPDADVRLGPIDLGKRQVTFEQRVSELFDTYPKLAEKKSLEPFPRWYRRMYTGKKQRSQEQYVNTYWQYALALVLTEEFFGNPVQDSSSRQSLGI